MTINDNMIPISAQNNNLKNLKLNLSKERLDGVLQGSFGKNNPKKNVTPQFNDKKDILTVTVEERNQRINALQNYMDNNYYSKAPTPEKGNQSFSNKENNVNLKASQNSNSSVSSSLNQNFRKKMFVSTRDVKGLGDAISTVSSKNDSKKLEIEKNDTGNKSFMNELSFFNDDMEHDGNVEEMHYFFVAFHQKSHQFLSRIESKCD